jgi:hypothetical protein
MGPDVVLRLPRDTIPTRVFRMGMVSFMMTLTNVTSDW